MGKNICAVCNIPFSDRDFLFPACGWNFGIRGYMYNFYSVVRILVWLKKCHMLTPRTRASGENIIRGAYSLTPRAFVCWCCCYICCYTWCCCHHLKKKIHMYICARNKKLTLQGRILPTVCAYIFFHSNCDWMEYGPRCVKNAPSKTVNLVLNRI